MSTHFLKWTRWLLCLMTVPFTAPLFAEEFRIANEHLVLVWNGQSGELRSPTENSVAVRSLQWPWKVARVERSTRSHPEFGNGESLLLRHENGWTTDLALFAESRFLHCLTTVTHLGEDPLVVRELPSATWLVDLGVPTTDMRVVGTGGLTGVADAQGSYTFSILADPDSRRGVVTAWLTHRQATGIFFPTMRTDTDGTTAAMVRCVQQFGRLQVDAGTSRETDTLLIGLCADCRAGIEAYAAAVSRNERIQLKPKPNVYCTWYHAGASDAEKLTNNTRFASANLLPFGLNVMQIDDLWQTPVPKEMATVVDASSILKHGPYKVFVEANQNYPQGMAAMANEIRRQRMIPGIWFMPFAGNHHNPYFDNEIFARRADGTVFDDDVAKWSGSCIDLSHPQGEAFVRERVKRIYDWGYRYFKIDGAHTGIPSPNIYVNTSYKDDRFGEAILHDPRVTHAQAYRCGLGILREESPDAFVLGCNVSQNMRSMGPAFGLLDAMRIGPDNGGASRGDWNQVTLGAWHGTNLYFLNNRVWYNDPDPVYVRPSNPLESARWMCTWMAISGSLHTSSEQYGELPAARLDLLKRCLPSHRLAARPVDYLERARPRLWRVGNDRLTVIGLFNWDEKQPLEIREPLNRIGLQPQQAYVAFDYWANRFVTPFTGDLHRTLPGGTCQSLAVRPATGHPQVISTSRHVTQGLMDVRQEVWNQEDRSLRGTSEVVAGDVYELRVVVPTGFKTGNTQAKCSDATCEIVNLAADPADTLRVVILPKKTGLAPWELRF